jgi:hypothetical protein
MGNLWLGGDHGDNRRRGEIAHTIIGVRAVVLSAHDRKLDELTVNVGSEAVAAYRQSSITRLTSGQLGR